MAGNAIDKKFPILSEDIEPVAAMLVGKWFARCEASKASEDAVDFEHQCRNFWYGMHGLEKIAIASRTANHFSIAMNNHIRMVADYIQDSIGIDPVNEPGWKW